MAEYRRYFVPGGTYFFTVVTQGRSPILCTGLARDLLRRALACTRARWPFQVDAVVLLPDHWHTIWTLPQGDSDFPRRWAFLKKQFTREWLAAGGVEEAISERRQARQRRGVWQPRFWEHLIRDEADFERHLDYIHFNPVKHQLAACPRDWPYSSFQRWVQLGQYAPDWACGTAGAVPTFDDLESSVGE
jgi:putative transposase